jgi:branched-chain amino acid transport system ATP-binding protein
VARGAVLGIIGPNGAGKTTLFNCLSGFMRPTSGEVYLSGRKVTGLSPSALCHLGMARTFQVTKPFPELTVLEAVQVALDQRRDKDDTLTADDVLDMVAFRAPRNMLGADMSVVNRKRLELARALATGPEVILLDEVCAGLAQSEVDELVEVLRAIRSSGVSLVMVEHVLPAVFALAEQVLVLQRGSVLASGMPTEVMKDPNVISAYLGSAAEHLSSQQSKPSPRPKVGGGATMKGAS